MCFALNMLRFRVRVREGAPAPRNDRVGWQDSA